MKMKKQDAAPVSDESEIVSKDNADVDTNVDEVKKNEEASTDVEAFAAELEEMRALVVKHETDSKEHYERLQYMAAEFDNYRRRTQKEKEKIYADASSEVVTAFLPVMDNLERAAKACESAEGGSSPEAKSLRDGIELVTRQFQDTLEKLGVQEIEAIGKPFDPALHNAVMHIEDDAFGENEVVDSFQKGYIHKNGIILRHSMVKVAN